MKFHAEVIALYPGDAAARLETLVYKMHISSNWWRIFRFKPCTLNRKISNADIEKRTSKSCMRQKEDARPAKGSLRHKRVPGHELLQRNR